MSLMESTGSASVDRFRSWAMARLPEQYEVDDALAGVELYQPEDLPELIEIFREAEKACFDAADWLHARRLDEQRQRREQMRPKGERFQKDPPNIKHELRGKAQVEFIVRWQGRALFLGEVRKLLEEELQSQETAVGSG
jgi:hypothetical protein